MIRHIMYIHLVLLEIKWTEVRKKLVRNVQKTDKHVLLSLFLAELQTIQFTFIKFITFIRNYIISNNVIEY